MTRMVMIAAATAAMVAAAPAFAAETLVVPFASVSTPTQQTYAGTVQITVSGIGTSNDTRTNDAFYYTGGTLQPGEEGYYQLAFGTAPLTGFNQSRAAFNFIPGGRPAYNPTGVYTFLLNTGLTTPGQLYFAVSDGIYGDNTGNYTLNIAAVPEPATWGMMILGFGMIGLGLRRRRPTVRTSVRFA